MINYSPFWNTLLKKKISQYKLINKYSISPSTLTRMKKNQSISLGTIEFLCEILNCNINDIVMI